MTLLGPLLGTALAFAPAPAWAAVTSGPATPGTSPSQLAPQFGWEYQNGWSQGRERGYTAGYWDARLFCQNRLPAYNLPDTDDFRRGYREGFTMGYRLGWLEGWSQTCRFREHASGADRPCPAGAENRYPAAFPRYPAG